MGGGPFNVLLFYLFVNTISVIVSCCWQGETTQRQLPQSTHTRLSCCCCCCCFSFSGENFQLNASKFPSSSTTLGVTYLIDLCLGCLHVCSLSLLHDIYFLLYLYLFHLLHSVTLYLIVWFYFYFSLLLCLFFLWYFSHRRRMAANSWCVTDGSIHDACSIVVHSGRVSHQGNCRRCRK